MWCFHHFVLNCDSDAAIEGNNFGFGDVTGPLTDVEGSCAAYSHALEIIKIDRKH